MTKVIDIAKVVLSSGAHAPPNGAFEGQDAGAMNSRESTELPPVESLDLEAQLEVSLALVKMRKRIAAREAEPELETEEAHAV